MKCPHLYSKDVSGGRATVSVQSAFGDGWVRARAAPGAHEPSCGMEPTTLMTSEVVVLAVTEKVIDTAVPVAVGDAVVGVVAEPVVAIGVADPLRKASQKCEKERRKGNVRADRICRKCCRCVVNIRATKL